MLDNFFDLSLQTRLLVYGLIVGLLAGVYLFSFHFPLADEIARYEKKVSELQAEKQSLQAEIAKGDTIQKEIAEIEGLFNKVTAQLPEQKEIPELLRQVSNLGKDSGLDVLLFRQQPEIKKSLHAEVPVEMSVKGGYLEIAMFFDQVRHLDRIVNIANLSIKNPQQKAAGARAQVETSFFATTYRFLSEEERRQAEEAAEKNKEGKK